MIIQNGTILPTPRILHRVETEMLDPVNGCSMLWCGRGSTALYWAYQLARLRSAGISQPEAIMPAISCASVPNTALLAGLKPRFADVDSQTGLMSLSHVQARLTSHASAVVFIHLYGQSADLGALAEWCRDNDLLLIEDNAHALGAYLPDGRPVGSVGDASIYSFNQTKILECGGGALLVRDVDLSALLERELRTHAPQCEPDADTAALLSESYRNLHHALAGLFRLRATSQIADLFLGVRPAYDSLFLRPMKDPAALAATWEHLPSQLEARFHKAEAYAAKLSGGPWQLLNGWHKSRVCWRYSLLFNAPDQLVGFSESVRRDGFHVSNLYWPLNEFFRPEDACPNADAFARRIVNLWVDSSVDTDWVLRCAASLRSRADETFASKGSQFN